MQRTVLPRSPLFESELTLVGQDQVLLSLADELVSLGPVIGFAIGPVLLHGSGTARSRKRYRAPDAAKSLLARCSGVRV